MDKDLGGTNYYHIHAAISSAPTCRGQADYERFKPIRFSVSDFYLYSVSETRHSSIKILLSHISGERGRWVYGFTDGWNSSAHGWSQAGVRAGKIPNPMDDSPYYNFKTMHNANQR